MAARNTQSAALEDNVEELDTTKKKSSKSKAKAAPEPEPETEQQLKNRLRNDAQRELLNKHRSEYNKIAEAKFAEHGLKFERRLNETEKAQRQLEKLLEKHPELRGQFGQEADREPTDDDVPEEYAPEDEPEEDDEAAYTEQYRG